MVVNALQDTLFEPVQIRVVNKTRGFVEDKFVDQFIAISIEALKQNSVPRFDIYLRVQDTFVLYCERGLEITHQHLSRLLENKIMDAYVLSTDIEAFRQYCEEHALEPSPEGDPLFFVDDGKYVPVTHTSLKAGTEVNFDIYCREKNRYNLVLPSGGDPGAITGADKILYIKSPDSEAYEDYLQKVLNAFQDKLTVEEKTALVYDNCKLVMRELLQNPRLTVKAAAATKLVDTIVEEISLDRAAMRGIIQIASHDYYTYTHSVNVCSFAIALARQMGINDLPSLKELGVGAMFHDLGKSQVDARLLRKKGNLTPEEFKAMKTHVMLGEELVEALPNIPPNAIYAISQHHERINGKGYPYGYSAERIHTFGRIVAICDCFDALTTTRSYQEARTPYAALQLMLGLEGCFDEKMLRELIKALGSL